MSALSFKNVGIRRDSVRQNPLNRNRSQVPIGIKTPLELDPHGQEMFKMNFSIRDQIRDNLRNLLLTNHGERLIQTRMGANLLPLVMEYTNKDDFDSEAMIRINTVITKFMPFVVPEDFESTVDRSENEHVGKVIIGITYSVPSLQVVRDKIEIILAVS